LLHIFFPASAVFLVSIPRIIFLAVMMLRGFFCQSGAVHILLNFESLLPQDGGKLIQWGEKDGDEHNSLNV